MSKTICIIGALKEETAGIKNAMMVTERVPSLGVDAGTWEGARIVLTRSGMGMARAEAALRQVCAQYRPEHVISIGLAGGLTPELAVGDVVLAETVLNRASGGVASLEIDLCWAAGLEAPAGVKIRRGILYTADEAVCAPAAKKSLAQTSGAVAVDMETAALLRCARELRLPFVSIRAISDTVEQELVNFSSCADGHGGISAVKAGWHIITHPGLIPQVIDLRQHARHAARNLTQVTKACLRRIA